MHQTENQVRFNINPLNPEEEINWVLTTQEGVQPTTSKPTIRISGDGVTAKDKTIIKKKKSSKIGAIALSAELGLLLGLLIPSIVDKVQSNSIIAPDKPDRIENIFSILNQAKLSQLFPQIIKTNDDDISYVATAFYLTHSYLKDSSNKDKYIQALKSISVSSDVALSSKGIIYYLLYKIDTKEKNTTEAYEYLNKCKTGDTYHVSIPN